MPIFVALRAAFLTLSTKTWGRGRGGADIRLPSVRGLTGTLHAWCIQRSGSCASPETLSYLFQVSDRQSNEDQGGNKENIALRAPNILSTHTARDQNIDALQT